MTIRAAPYGLFRDYRRISTSASRSSFRRRFVTQLRWLPQEAELPPVSANPFVNYPGGSSFPNYGFQKQHVSDKPYVGPRYTFRISPRCTLINGTSASKKQVGTGWVLSANYMGSEATHVLNSIEGNPAVYIPGTCIAGQYGLTAAGAVFHGEQYNSAEVTVLCKTRLRGVHYGSMVTEKRHRNAELHNALFLTATHRIGRRPDRDWKLMTPGLTA